MDGLVEIDYGDRVFALEPIDSIEERSEIQSLIKSLINRHNSYEAERRRIKAKLGRPITRPKERNPESDEEDQDPPEPEEFELYDEVEDPEERMKLIDQLDELNQKEEVKSNENIQELIAKIRPKVKEGDLDALAGTEIINLVVAYIKKHQLSEEDEGN